MPKIADWEKQPNDQQDFDFIFSDYITSMGEALGDAHTISSVTYSGNDTSLVIQSSTIHNGVTLNGATECFIQVWLAGGTSGQTYKLTARIATFGGRIHEVEAKLKVKDD
jgi:hypothetical protein